MSLFSTWGDGSSARWLALTVVLLACGPVESPNSTDQPGTSTDRACGAAQRMADGSCCGSGTFADISTGSCLPFGPPECRQTAWDHPQTCVPRWCQEIEGEAGQACDGGNPEGDGCAAHGRRCTTDEVEAGQGCAAGSWPHPTGAGCVGAGADLTRLVDGIDEGVPGVVVPPGVPVLDKLPPVNQTGFCRHAQNGAARLCRVDEQACKQGHMTDPQDSDVCLPVGVTWVCPPGFEHDAAQSDDKRIGCKPSTSACPNAKWPAANGQGDHHVDALAACGGDGSVNAPWSSIGAAVAASKSGDTLLVAAGLYIEHVELTHGLTIQGVCAAKVRVQSEDASHAATITVNAGASQTQVVLKGLSIGGVRGGVHVHGVGALLESIEVQSVQGDAVAAVAGADVVLRRSLIHDVQAPGTKQPGTGVRVQDATTSVRDVQIDRVKRRGIWASGAKALVTATSVRIQRTSTEPDLGAPGVRVDTGASLSCRNCAIADTWTYGVYVIGPDTAVDLLGLTVEDVPLDAAPHLGGAGIGARSGAKVHVQGARIARVQGGGLVAHHVGTMVTGSALISEELR